MTSEYRYAKLQSTRTTLTATGHFLKTKTKKTEHQKSSNGIFVKIITPMECYFKNTNIWNA
jgi:hypothetical protein